MSQLPKVGDGATYSIGSDSYPMTIIEVSKSGYKVTAQHDSAEMVEGSEYTNDAVYRYERNPSGSTLVFTNRKDGQYRAVGCSNYGRLTLGIRHKRRNPEF